MLHTSSRNPSDAAMYRSECLATLGRLSCSHLHQPDTFVLRRNVYSKPFPIRCPGFSNVHWILPQAARRRIDLQPDEVALETRPDKNTSRDYVFR